MVKITVSVLRLYATTKYSSCHLTTCLSRLTVKALKCQSSLRETKILLFVNAHSLAKIDEAWLIKILTERMVGREQRWVSKIIVTSIWTNMVTISPSEFNNGQRSSFSWTLWCESGLNHWPFQQKMQSLHHLILWGICVKLWQMCLWIVELQWPLKFLKSFHLWESKWMFEVKFERNCLAAFLKYRVHRNEMDGATTRKHNAYSLSCRRCRGKTKTVLGRQGFNGDTTMQL